MARISKEVKTRILEAAKIEDFIPGLKKTGKNYYTKCPKCNKSGKGKGLIVNKEKQLAKCFACDFTVVGAVNYLKEVDGKTYPEALEEIAKHNSIDIESDAQRQKRLASEKVSSQKRKQKTFRDDQLKSSGLVVEDIIAKVKDDKKDYDRPTFVPGTKDQYGQILPLEGDDMLIYYYDLEGKPVMYKRPRGNKFEPLIRVRWKNPKLHLDKNKRPIKYQSPAGSGSHIYIPERIRQLYKRSRKIDRLFIQEGEKKAEKACKHGVMSVAIMGIQNLGYQNQLPPEMQLIIERCEVKEVVFMLDSDWNKLSATLKNGDYIDQRPRSFFYAVKNYKEYMRTLLNKELSLEIYFGYVRPNEKDDKGFDDLLTNTLVGRESEIIDDLKHASNERDGEGEYVNLHKISVMSDMQLADLWLLNDADKFAQEHKKEIEHLSEFYIKKIKRRFNDAGELEMAQPLLPSEQYWEESITQTRAGFERKEYNFNYAKCFRFLQNRGYWRIRLKTGEWEFISINNKVVSKVDQYDIKDFVTTFTKELKDKEDVLNMLYRGGPQYLGQEKLSNLEYNNLRFERAEKYSQNIFFKDVMWQVTAEGIKEVAYSQMKDHVWNDKLIDFQPTLYKPMVDFKSTNDNEDLPNNEFLVELSKEGSKCHFLQFLMNASDFTWRKRKKGEEVSIEEDLHNTRHFLNKLTAMGYLLHDYKNDSELKAVICMDGKLSEVGSSNGRTGKSLFGRAIEEVIPQVYISAKSKKLTEDNFLFGEVNEKIKNLFLDDVRANVDFEFFFPLITGKLKVNAKGLTPYTLSSHDTPKLLITTNHAINGEGSSFKDRQAFVAFSDKYNENHKPIDDFKQNFFSEWDKDQWNYFYNFMATCLVMYFRSLKNDWSGVKGQGIVIPPMDDLETRRLRQQIGEDFLTWADEVFSAPAPHGELNNRTLRRELFDSFKVKNPHQVKYVTPAKFAKKLKYYCKYKDLHFNPSQPNDDDINFDVWSKNNEGSFIGKMDKSGGKEYITVADDTWLMGYPLEKPAETKSTPQYQQTEWVPNN